MADRAAHSAGEVSRGVTAETQGIDLGRGQADGDKGGAGQQILLGHILAPSFDGARDVS
jgi:hypothetical protein